jgi:hypothetical protein
MRKFFALLSLICVGVLSANAAPNPKATGDFGWINPYSGQQVNITFNAIATTATGSGAKGSLIYEDPNVQYTMDVQFIKVDPISHKAKFAGQITAATGAYSACCNVGDWVFYEVFDGGEPGIGYDRVWGEDITQGRHVLPADTDTPRLLVTGTGPNTDPYMGDAYTAGIPTNDGNIQIH